VRVLVGQAKERILIYCLQCPEIRHRIPLLIDVLYSLCMDSEVLNHSNFEEWAGACGYDVDSRKAEKLFDECLKQALHFKNLIGFALLEKLQNLFRDY